VRSFSQAAVMFNQPMVALGDFEGADQSLLTLDPPLPGRVVWLNQYTLAFVAETPALRDLEVKVTLSPEVTSLSGARPDGPRTVSFSLPELKLAVDWSRVITENVPEEALRPVVSVAFNLPVDPDSMNGKSFFVWGPAGATERVPADWTRPRNGGGTPNRIQAAPASELPKAAKWALVIGGDASPVPGRPPLGEDFVAARGETYGELKVTPYGFSRTVADGNGSKGVLGSPEYANLTVQFSNPVRMAQAAAFIEMDPPHPAVTEIRKRWARRAASTDASRDSGVSPDAASSSTEVDRDGIRPGDYDPDGARQGDYDPDGAWPGDYDPDGAWPGDYDPDGAWPGDYDPDGAWPGDYDPDGARSDSVMYGLNLYGDFLAETEYAITFRKGFGDIYGQTLAEDRVIRFLTGPFAPASGLASPGGIMESAFPPAVPVWIRNLPKAEFFALVMSDAETAGLLDMWGAGFGQGPHRDVPDRVEAWLEAARRRGPGPYAAEVVPIGDSSRRTVRQSANLSDLSGGREREGVVLAGSPHGYGYSFYQVTDLAITAKIGRTGSVAWVTRLSDGGAVGGASVAALDCAGKELWTGTTGGDGLARLPGGPELAADVTGRCRDGGYGTPSLYLTASKEGERVFWSMGWTRGFHRYDMGIGEIMNPLSPGWAGSFLVTSQPVYRPGETARLKAVIRRFGDDSLLLPERGAARAIIRDPMGNVALDAPVEVSPYGTVSLDCPIPEDGAYGTWRLTVDLAPERKREADSLSGIRRGSDVVEAGGFSVRFYRAPAFGLALDGMPDRFAGDAAGFGVKGSYHFGAPLDGGEAEFRLSHWAYWGFRPPGYGPEWSFTAYTALTKADEGGWSSDPDPPGTAADGKVPIAADGTASFEAAIPDGGPPVPRSYTLAVTAMDRDGRAVSASGGFTAHPARLYAGISAAGLLAEPGKPFALKVAAVAPDGTAAPGARVKVSLYRRTWTTARRLAPGGRYALVSGFADSLVSERTVTAGDEPVGIEVTPEAAGPHFATAELADSGGRKALASLDLWVTGEGAGWPARDGESLELAADAALYRPGDVARILVQSPFESGTGLLTVERGGVREARVFDLAGGAPVLEIPIGEEDAPSVYASVILVRGRTAPPPARGEEDLGKPSFRRGYLTLRVMSDRDRLKVEVTPDGEEAAPGSEAAVRIRVTDSAGNPFPDCEVALAAVDAGLIQIGGDWAFRPEHFLWQFLPLRVQTASSLAEVLDASDWSGKGGGSPGGGGGFSEGGQGELRRDFRSVAHFDPAVALDGNGEAEVSFRLPDNLTTFRIFAVATGKGREAGTGEGRITVTQALVLRSALPNHLTAGDEFQASAVVTSRAAGEAELTVEIVPEAGLELLEEPRKSLALAPGGSVEVAFRARASAAGTLSAGFVAALGGQTDRSLFAVPVSLAGRETVDASVSRERAGSPLPEARLPEAADPSRGGLELVFSPGVAGTLDAPLRALEDCPYDGLEQSTSRAAGALHALRLGERAGTLAAERRAVLEGKVKEQIVLLESRSVDGGFSAWPEGGWNSRSPALTAWVLDFLREAQDSGFAVPEGLVARSADYLAAELSREPRMRGAGAPSHSDSTRLYVMGALFRAGRPLEGTLEPYYAGRTGLNLIERILLLRAAGALPPSSVREERLAALVPMVASELELSGATARIRVPERRAEHGLWLSGGDDISALALLALSEAAPRHELLPALLLGSASSGTRRWSTNRAANVIRGAWNILEAESEGDDGAAGAAGRQAAPPEGEGDAAAGTAAGRQAAPPEGDGDAAAGSGAGQGAEGPPGPDLAVKVLQGDRTVMEGRLRGPRSPELRAALTAAELLAGPPPAWDIEGQGELWSFRRLSWAPAEPDLSAQWTRGLSLARSFQRVRPEPGAPGESAFRRGEIVKVTVTLMTNVARHDLALEDPVPAGLEPVDFRSRDKDPNLYGLLAADAGGTGDSWNAFHYWYDHEEIRPDSVRLFADDLEPGVYTYSYLARAVTPGIYVLPGPYAEEMYNPENHGRGAGLRITVEK
jgi:uncharacterized protein YfaS (alpha-2-macroglobulin family)